MDIDAAIRGQLDQELAESSPPPMGSLVTDAVTAGQRLRRRRRAATFGGAAAGALLLATGGMVLSATLRGTAAPETAGAPPVVVQTAAPSVSPPPESPTGVTPEVIVARLIPMLPPGGEVSVVEGNSDEFGADVTLTYTVGGKTGQITVGVLAGEDPARFVCHNPKDKTCKRTVTDDGVTVRSLMLDKQTVRVDADLPGDVIVFVEADKSVLGRTRAVAIATDLTWLDVADPAEIAAAAQTVDTLRKPGG
jgi:hypothetical protein